MESADLISSQISCGPFVTQLRNRDWSIDVIERLHWNRGIQNLIDNLQAVGEVGSHHHHVGIGNFRHSVFANIAPVLVQMNPAERRLRHVTVGGIPLKITLVENYVMPSFM